MYLKRRVYDFLALQKWKLKGLFTDSSLCLEGFPRSANTFTTRAIELSMKDMKFIHHQHKRSVLLHSIKNDIATVALIRQPVGCISSLCVLKRKKNDEFIKDAVNWYVDYYSWMLTDNYADKYSVLFFDDITKDVNLFFKELRNKFKIDAPKVNHDEVYQYAKSVADSRKQNPKEKHKQYFMPSEDKEELADLRKEINDIVRNHEYLEKANDLYAKLEKKFRKVEKF